MGEERIRTLWNSETSLATSKLNDNTTQMSVPIVRNKSLSSYKCAAKLGPSDSLITSLSWVCLCCLNCCLLGPNIPHATVATATESHKRAKKAFGSYSACLLIRTARQKGPSPAGRLSPRPVHLRPHAQILSAPQRSQYTQAATSFLIWTRQGKQVSSPQNERKAQSRSF